MRTRVERRLVVVGPAQERLVENLVAARLVSSGDGNLQIAHEALATHWPRLRVWLEEDVEGQRIFRHLTAEAEAWESAAGPRATSTAAPGWSGRPRGRSEPAPPSPPPSATSWPRASTATPGSGQEAQDRERGRRSGRLRLRALVGLAAVLLATALVTGVLVVVQASRAGDARAAAAEAGAGGGRPPGRLPGHLGDRPLDGAAPGGRGRTPRRR